MYKILLTKPKLIIAISLCASLLVLGISLFGLFKVARISSDTVSDDQPLIGAGQKFEEALDLITTKTRR